MNIIKFYDNDFSCFNKNDKVNYTFLTIKGLTNPKYLTNITIFLTLISLFLKSKKITNILFPLLITNGVFISIYCLIFLEKFLILHQIIVIIIIKNHPAGFTVTHSLYNCFFHVAHNLHTINSSILISCFSVVSIISLFLLIPSNQLVHGK